MYTALNNLMKKGLIVPSDEVEADSRRKTYAITPRTKFNWRYFRRTYLEGEATTELYSDKESILSFYRKVQRTLGVVALVNLMTFLLSSIHWINGWSGPGWILTTIGVLNVMQLLCMLLLGYGVLKYQKFIKLHTD